ncbi:MAG: YitT family protein [Mucinivorans sp.]
MGQNLTLKKVLREIKTYGIISVGLIIYSFAFTTMLLPAGIVSGGAGGLGMLLYYAFGEHLTLGVYYFIVNAVFIFFGVIIIGPKFGIKTIYAILFNTMALSLMQLYIPPDILGMNPETDKLLLAILGGVSAGVGIAFCFTQGGSSGGTDIIAMIINKYRNISLGKIIMMCDVLIITSSYFVFGEIKPIIYGFVTMGMVGYTIDLVLSGSKQSAQIMIFSNKYDEIGHKIIHEAHRGVSYLNGEGGFSGQPQKVVVVVCRKSEQSEIYRIIKEVDPNAFITVGSVMGVFGKGFDSLRDTKNKK